MNLFDEHVYAWICSMTVFSPQYWKAVVSHNAYHKAIADLKRME